jgi:hypothetical protein
MRRPSPPRKTSGIPCAGIGKPDSNEVLSWVDLVNPNCDEVIGRQQEGEELQDPMEFWKSDLIFLSENELPRCWTYAHYRDDELRR